MNDFNFKILGKTGTTSGETRRGLAKQLLRAIFQGQLPAGTRLLVMKLAEHFALSSTPCREALVELDAIGVVEFIPNRGAVVASFGPNELRDIYQLRSILETEATKCACGRIDDESLRNLQRSMISLQENPGDSKWPEKEIETDLELHRLISANCGSIRLAKEIRRYNLLVQTIREVIGDHPEAERRALRDHLEILKALRKGDAVAAADSMARHIEAAAQWAEKVMFADNASGRQSRPATPALANKSRKQSRPVPSRKAKN